jgi:hypothetical protein
MNAHKRKKLAKIAKYKEMLEKQNKPPDQPVIVEKIEEQKPSEQQPIIEVKEEVKEEIKSSILKKKKTVNEPV